MNTRKENEFSQNSEVKTRGRTKKTGDEKKQPISAYIHPDIHEAIKIIARAKGQNLSDLIEAVLATFVERNKKQIEDAVTVMKMAGAISFND